MMGFTKNEFYSTMVGFTNSELAIFLNAVTVFVTHTCGVPLDETEKESAMKLINALPVVPHVKEIAVMSIQAKCLSKCHVLTF